METPASIPPPLATPVARSLPETDDRPAPVLQFAGSLAVPNTKAAHVLVQHLFAHADAPVAGIEYAVGYQLAHGLTGGDIVDVYHFDNDAVSISIADISGKGTEAAIHAAMLKYGLRAYASHGLTPESVLRALDRFYIEHNAFERIESFATVFFGMVDASRRMMCYASGGHEAAAVIVPGEAAQTLPPTAPLIGVFDDQHHLFKQSYIDLPPGSLFVATTDGITEARAPDGEFFGIERFLETIESYAEAPVELIARELIGRARTFSSGNLRDDIAVVAVRFP